MANVNKVLLSLNDNVHLKLNIAYIGCRLVDKYYTYSKLVMALISNAADDKPSILVNDDNMKFYTFKDCYDLGLRFIKEVLSVLNNVSSIDEVTIKLGEGLSPFISDTQISNISSSIMKKCILIDGKVVLNLGGE